MPVTGPRPRPYLCKIEFGGCGLHHVGLLPTMVIAGVCTATEWYETYRGGKPLRHILPPLIAYLTDRVRATETPQVARRAHPVTDDDLWTLTVKTPRGQLVAADRDSPAEAAAVIVHSYACADKPEEVPAE